MSAPAFEQRLKWVRRGECYECGRKPRKNSSRVIYLFETEEGSAILCGAACLARYSDGPELNSEEV